MNINKINEYNENVLLFQEEFIQDNLIAHI